MSRKVVHVIGTGTIGEPLIGLLCDFKKDLGIDSNTVSKEELVEKAKQNVEPTLSKARKQNIGSSKKIWSVVLGKFSLAFSMAPEFYRRVYKRNPNKNFKTIEGGENNKLISPTSWEELAKRKK